LTLIKVCRNCKNKEQPRKKKKLEDEMNNVTGNEDAGQLASEKVNRIWEKKWPKDQRKGNVTGGNLGPYQVESGKAERDGEARGRGKK